MTTTDLNTTTEVSPISGKPEVWFTDTDGQTVGFARKTARQDRSWTVCVVGGVGGRVHSRSEAENFVRSRVC